MQIKLAFQKKQSEAFNLSLVTPVLFYGGAKGGGKSWLIRAKEMALRLKYPKTTGLIVRRTYPELMSNHIRKFWQEYPITRIWYKAQDKAIQYPNGSITEFAYLRRADDVYNFQGREYDNISVDEITQHPEIVYKILRSSLRTTNKEAVKAGFKPSMLLTGNPGGVGHASIKRLFINRQFREGENPSDYGFVQALVSDNEVLMDVDPGYIKRLEDLPASLMRAYLHGDWNMHAGSAFSEMEISKHVVKPFRFDGAVKYYAGYDHGFNHPYSFVLGAMEHDEQTYLIKHLAGRKQRPDEIAKRVLKHTKHLTTNGSKIMIFAGGDLWNKQRDGSPSVYDQFLDAGLTPRQGYLWIKANDDRVQGVAEIRKYLAWRNTANKTPLLRFFENTIDVYNCVAGMQFDALKPEDVMKVDADSEGFGGDDDYDAFRYMLMGRISPPKSLRDGLPVDSGEYMLENLLKEGRKQRQFERYK